MPDDIGIAANGRLGAHKRANLIAFRLSVDLVLPPCDGLRGDAKHPCGFLVGERKKLPNSENPVALGGPIMRPSSFRKSIPPRSHDAGDLCVQPDLERVSFGFSKKSGETILRITKLRETDADGEAQKLVGLQKGTDGKLFDMAGFGNFEDGSFNEGIFHGASPCLAWRS